MKARGLLLGLSAVVAVAVMAIGAVGGASAGVGGNAGPSKSGVPLQPGNLLVNTSVYDEDAATVEDGKTVLPPGCTGEECAIASAGASYPEVWNNDGVDANFGITSPIYLDQITPSGEPVSTIEVPNSTQNGVPATKDQMVTSFSSKSEGALNLSTDGSAVTFMGYLAPVNALDVSNSNTPGVIDPTNPDVGPYYRVIAELGANGKFHFTKTNAFSGDNGRGAILNHEEGANVLYMAGNAGNGASPQPEGIVLGGGAQIATPQVKAEVAQEPGLPTPVGAFSVTQLGQKQDKIGKDTNFRGVTIYDNVLYYTKGSGSNGVNTVYFVDTTGHACPNGVGLPEPGAKLPTEPLAYEPEKLAESGLTPQNMCILKGFPTALKSKTSFPFAIWFANPTTLYVSDEGNAESEYSTATGTYTKAAAQKTAGLQKWVLKEGSWKLAYTLQSGLELGKPYTVSGYPTGNNPATGLPWSPATDGLRNITGRVNPDGTATIWGITSTVSGNGDVGADPNKLVGITDQPSATSPATGESFQTTKAAGFGEVLRGVSLTPTNP